MGEEGRHPGEGVDPARLHRHRAQRLGRQGQDRRGREPVLPGEDGVNSRRAQDHLQAEGGLGGQLVIFLSHILFSVHQAKSNTLYLVENYYKIFSNLFHLDNLISNI